MVIQHLDNRQFRSARYRLGELVMINQDELARDRLQKVALGKEADELLVAVDDRKNRVRGVGHHLASRTQRRLRVEAGEIGIDHALDAHRASG